MNRDLLIIFVKNPQAGKVKTRLAEALGNHTALSIYRKLITYTHKVTRPLPQQKVVFFSDFIELGLFDQTYHSQVQRGADLGERMENAFAWGFNQGYTRICIIGSDCLELQTKTLLDAFEFLEQYQVVVGPSEDGGYYLLGMRQLHTALFRDKPWSTEEVFSHTEHTLKILKLTYGILPTLNDIDREEDLPEAWKLTHG